MVQVVVVSASNCVRSVLGTVFFSKHSLFCCVLYRYNLYIKIFPFLSWSVGPPQFSFFLVLVSLSFSPEIQLPITPNPRQDQRPCTLYWNSHHIKSTKKMGGIVTKKKPQQKAEVKTEKPPPAVREIHSMIRWNKEWRLIAKNLEKYPKLLWGAWPAPFAMSWEFFSVASASVISFVRSWFTHKNGRAGMEQTTSEQKWALPRVMWCLNLATCIFYQFELPS